MSKLRHRAFTSAINLPSHRRGREIGDVVDEDAEEEEDNTPHGDGKRRKKERRKTDVIQRRAKLQVQRAQAKTNRMRQATIGEGDISDSELVRLEVETDVADALAKTTRTRKKTKSITESDQATSSGAAAASQEGPSTLRSRRRSQRLRSRDPVVVQGIMLPRPDQATGVTKEALKMLERKRDTDQALEQLKTLKK